MCTMYERILSDYNCKIPVELILAIMSDSMCMHACIKLKLTSKLVKMKDGEFLLVLNVLEYIF